MPTADGWLTRAADADGTAPILAEGARQVIVGKTPNAVIADWNTRGIPATDGGLWHADVLRDILRSPRLADLGIISDEEFRQLQVVLDARAQTHNPVAEGRNYLRSGLLRMVRRQGLQVAPQAILAVFRPMP